MPILAPPFLRLCRQVCVYLLDMVGTQSTQQRRRYIKCLIINTVGKYQPVFDFRAIWNGGYQPSSICIGMANNLGSSQHQLLPPPTHQQVGNLKHNTRTRTRTRSPLLTALNSLSISISPAKAPGMNAKAQGMNADAKAPGINAPKSLPAPLEMPTLADTRSSVITVSQQNRRSPSTRLRYDVAEDFPARCDNSPGMSECPPQAHTLQVPIAAYISHITRNAWHHLNRTTI